MLLKERASGMYRLSSFYIARTVSDLPLNLTYPTGFVVIIYFMGGLRPEAGAFFFNWITVMVMVLVAESWGLLLGAVTQNVKTAQTIATILTLSFMLVGGFYTTGVPGWLDWVKWISFIYYGFSLGQKIEFSNVERSAYSGFTIDPKEFPYEIFVLVAWLVALRIAIYFILRYKTRKV